MYHSIQGMAELCRTNNIDLKKFEAVLLPQISLSFIAISKNSDQRIVAQWKNAAQEIKNDGTFEKLAQKWVAYTQDVVGVPCEVKSGALQFWRD